VGLVRVLDLEPVWVGGKKATPAGADIIGSWREFVVGEGRVQCYSRNKLFIDDWKRVFLTIPIEG